MKKKILAIGLSTMIFMLGSPLVTFSQEISPASLNSSFGKTLDELKGNISTSTTLRRPSAVQAGSCGAKKYKCKSGKASGQEEDKNQYFWQCNSINGGRNVNCLMAKNRITNIQPAQPIPTLGGKISGRCGVSRNTCKAGKIGLNGENAKRSYWQCKGWNGGASVTCSIPKSTTAIGTQPVQPTPTLGGTAIGTQPVQPTPTLGGTAIGTQPVQPIPTLGGTAGVFRGRVSPITQPVPKPKGITVKVNPRPVPILGKVDGVCGTSRQTCKLGRDGYLPDSLTEYLWSCRGLNGGEDVDCALEIPQNPILPTPIDKSPIPTNGDCGGSVKTCTAGIFVDDPTDTNLKYRWTCVGIDGGRSDICEQIKTVRQSPINGVCGDRLKQCSTGTYSINPADSKTRYFWTCSGKNGGGNAICSQKKSSNAINGACGTTKETCDIGKYNPYPADTKEQYRWICEGSNGGRHARCSQVKSGGTNTRKINGVCGANENCRAGTYVNLPVDTKEQYLWTCNGVNGGTKANCSRSKSNSTKIDGVCGIWAENCRVGTYVNLPVDTAKKYLWTCKGKNGGVDTTCSYMKIQKTDGVCGSKVGDCNIGIFKFLPSTNTTSTWECSGYRGGKNATCKASVRGPYYTGFCNNGLIRNLVTRSFPRCAASRRGAGWRFVDAGGSGFGQGTCVVKSTPNDKTCP